MSWEVILIAGLSGGIFGTVATLWAPWINWGIEKRRNKMGARRALVQQIYSMSAGGGSRENFRKSSAYSKIRRHLSSSLIEDIERGDKQVVIVRGGGRASGVNPFWIKLVDEVTALETKWKLL